MEVAIVCFVISALFIVPITVVTLLDLLRTRKWVRTVGWERIIDAVLVGDTRQVAALYAIYKKDLHWRQQVTVEAHIRSVDDRVLAKLLARGRGDGSHSDRNGDGDWTWTETVAPPGEPGGNPEPK